MKTKRLKMSACVLIAPHIAVSSIALLTLLTPASALTVLSGSGTIELSDPTQIGRLLRDDIPSTWAAGLKSFPGVINTTTQYHYDAVSVSFAPNAMQDIFYEITWTNLTAASPHSAAYNTAFFPNTAGPPFFGFNVNYLGDGGVTPGPLASNSYQVIVPAGGQLLLQFGSVNFDLGLGPESYTYTVAAFSDANRDENFGETTVTPLPAALPLFATGLSALGLLGWRRKRKAQAAA